MNAVLFKRKEKAMKKTPILFMFEEDEDNTRAFQILTQAGIDFSLIPVEGRGVPSLSFPGEVFRGLWSIEKYIKNKQSFLALSV